MVDWATVLASVGLSVAGSVLVTEFKIRRERSVEESAEVEQWYDESASYASQVRRTWQRLYDSPEQPSMNLSEIQSELSLLEGQISRHASEGEQLGANQQVIDKLDDLARECRRTGERPLHLASGSEFEEFREDVLSVVETLEDALDNR